jgi:anti-sigma28 factor (negative regulator of flagellin synthesis)
MAPKPVRTEAQPRVLIAEDDEDTGLLLVKVLRADGYAIVECRDGAGLFRRSEPFVVGTAVPWRQGVLHMSDLQSSHKRVRYEGCPQQALAEDRCRRAAAGTSSCPPARRPAAGQVGCQKRGASAGSGQRSAGVRRRRVQAIRRQIRQGSYEVNTRMARILDRVLEDLVTTATEPDKPTRGRGGGPTKG